MFELYKLSLMLYKTFNEAIPKTEWVGLNFQQITMSRQREFKIVKSNNLVVRLTHSVRDFIKGMENLS
jgi:hypothetical protein